MRVSAVYDGLPEQEAHEMNRCEQCCAIDERPFQCLFPMEIALDPTMPTYERGLGVLAGGTIRSAAELKVPRVVVSLLHRKGRERLPSQGRQQMPAGDRAVSPALFRADEILGGPASMAALG